MTLLATATCLGSAAAGDLADVAPLPDQTVQDDTPQPQTLYLEVTLNQADRGLTPFELVDGHLRGSVETLRKLGFILADRAAGELVDLDRLPDVEVRYDAALQRLALQVPLAQLSLSTTVLKTEEVASPSATASPGILLNYDFYATRNTGTSSVSLATELRGFGIGRGMVDTTAVFLAYDRPQDERWRSEAVRLDSAWQMDFPDSATSLTVGDFYSGFVDWSRSIRLGGVQIGRNYALQPYRVLTPTPSFLGEAAVPSTVELYVDGLRQYSGRVPAGPFQLAAQPGISGTGQAQIVVTDAFGRVRRLDFAFYSTPQLLARGISEWSAGIGHLRRDYGVRSFSYESRAVASATFRKGLREDVTIEAHAEAGGGVVNVGAGGIWLLGVGGVFNLAYVHSRMDDLRGGQYVLGYAWNNRRFNFNIGTQRTHGDYRDLGALQGSVPARISDRAVFGVNVEPVGSLGTSYVRLSYPQGDTSRYASVFWSRGFGRNWAGNLSGNQNLGLRSDRSLYLSLSTTFGGSRQASASMQRNGNRTGFVADISQPLPGDGDLGGIGWRLQGRAADDAGGGLAELGWLNRVGRYNIGAANQDGANFGYASASGSLVWMNGRGFAARDIQDAFAVVSTDGQAGIPVRLENRLIGVTDARGTLLVTPLQSWQRNQLSIDTLNLPADLRVDRVDTAVTPRRQSGVAVGFGITRVRAAVIVLHDAQGAPLPVGSVVQREGDVERVVVGYDGETYLDNLQIDNRIFVELPDGRCSARFTYPANPNGIPRIGPLKCIAEPLP
ncbi:fimbria/pilus outer membrane usher protein [Xanthomonas fragariae]|uniref:fimbria/pilus outer membrane usher protein n=1 Tax=Xanthomonas fragariae TaxID=48664 RepID=UPI000D550A53|nr:fimbria/pilus outer membrane usher protein [Xanthomonas fragariae]MDM7554027.1 fimbria/pilus outer membrane usher protein [Xanthomonas fragariae]MDM7557148.1 fimbria/pilus outer membrane usher protein [Xanthomonas fragariae]MDM7574843.1 fimbria/pilus outer membrane usher protein [Xanthomonas fragariae]MDM7577967.1 fimbria/pilus outer membrane usher protein [Xanthomonas fragariae]MDM7588164.1 fimbria/pilus outer membrane usher protein [Xanthomonas fragariae]